MTSCVIAQAYGFSSLSTVISQSKCTGSQIEVIKGKYKIDVHSSNQKGHMRNIPHRSGEGSFFFLITDFKRNNYISIEEDVNLFNNTIVMTNMGFAI